MHKRFLSLSLKCTAVILLTAVAFPVLSQSRLSLSERVARLEQQGQGQNASQATVDLMNQLSQLQEELQNLRGVIEKQTYEIEQLKSQSRDQYIDLDTRISQLEGGHSTSSEVNSAANINPTTIAQLDSRQAEKVIEPLKPGQLMAEEPVTTTPSPETTRIPEAPVNSGNQAAVAMPTTSLSGSSSNPVDEKTAYENAFAALREGRYAESASRFSEFIEQFPDGEFADNASYWLGESYYVTQNYRIALDTFQGLLSKYPQSTKAPDALLKVAYCYYELNEWDQAEQSLNKVIQTYPDTTVARLAQGRLRALRVEQH